MRAAVGSKSLLDGVIAYLGWNHGQVPFEVRIHDVWQQLALDNDRYLYPVACNITDVASPAGPAMGWRCRLSQSAPGSSLGA